MIAGSLRVPLPSWVGTGVCADCSPRASPSPIAVPPSATIRSSAPLTAPRSVVGETICCA